MQRRGTHGRSYNRDKMLPKVFKEKDSIGLPQEEYSSKQKKVVAKRHKKKTRQYYKQNIDEVIEEGNDAE